MDVSLASWRASGKCLDQQSSAVISKFKARISYIHVVGDCEKYEVACSRRKWVTECVSLGRHFALTPPSDLPPTLEAFPPRLS